MKCPRELRGLCAWAEESARPVAARPLDLQPEVVLAASTPTILAAVPLSAAAACLLH